MKQDLLFQKLYRAIRGLTLSSLVLMSGVIMFESCKDTEDLPFVPEITFKSGTASIKIDTTLNEQIPFYDLEIDFVDGDGDIGLNKEDTTGIYDRETGEFYNLVLTLYELNTDSVFVEKELPTPYSTRIQFIENRTQFESLKGTIEYQIQLSRTFVRVMRFDVQLLDRALNKSNVIETPSFQFRFSNEEL